jgi:hypothetical protein
MKGHRPDFNKINSLIHQKSLNLSDHQKLMLPLGQSVSYKYWYKEVDKVRDGTYSEDYLVKHKLTKQMFISKKTVVKNLSVTGQNEVRLQLMMSHKNLVEAVDSFFNPENG